MILSKGMSFVTTIIHVLHDQGSVYCVMHAGMQACINPAGYCQYNNNMQNLMAMYITLCPVITIEKFIYTLTSRIHAAPQAIALTYPSSITN